MNVVHEDYWGHRPHKAVIIDPSEMPTGSPKAEAQQDVLSRLNFSTQATASAPEKTEPGPSSASASSPTANGLSLRFAPRLILPLDITQRLAFDRSRLHFVNHEFNKGDTLVFIDYPDCPRDYRRQADCYGVAFRSQQLRVSSEKLLATGSSKFADMLNPTYQFRIKRRRRMVNSMPDGVKFLLDLTPPSEGDELVFQMTELSLTPGITKWWTSSAIHKTDANLVTGHDDVCYCSMPSYSQVRHPEAPYQLERVKQEPSEEASKDGGATDDNEDDTQQRAPTKSPSKKKKKKKLQGKSELLDVDGEEVVDNVLTEGVCITPETLLQLKAKNHNVVYNVPAYREIPDYCPFRHRNNIIRLLLLIQGEHIMLDSAARVWTLVGLAKILDCTSALRDEVAQWIMHGNNVRLIEILPEEAFQIGYALQISEVTQCAFRILVNELALEEAATNATQIKFNPVTLFGRRRSALGDELNNIVQHAARALVERITREICRLRDPNFLDSTPAREWDRLRRLEQDLTQLTAVPETIIPRQNLQNLMGAIREVLPGLLDKIQLGEVARSPVNYSSMDFDRATYVEPRDFEVLQVITKRFNMTQRFLCSMMYHELSEEIKATFSSTSNLWNLRKSQNYLRHTEAALQVFVRSCPDMLTGNSWVSVLGPSNSPDNVATIRTPLCNLYQLGEDVKCWLHTFLNSWVRHDIDPALNVTRHLLLTLHNDEMKFLPLWAGGCDDGTGGVFEPVVPLTDLGPNGPGPAYHTGLTVPSASSTTGSMAEDLGAMRIMGSTTAGSVDVHDSISTVYRPDEIIAEDVSIASEAFTATDSDYRDARFVVPVPGQGIGQVIEALCDSSTDRDTDSIMTDTDSQSVDSNMLRQHSKKAQAADNDDSSFIWDGGDDNDSDGDMDFI